MDAGSLFATLRSSSREAVVWRGAGSSVRGWREASIFTGRVPEPFQIVFTSRRSLSYPGDIAIDDINFRNCALPRTSPTHISAVLIVGQALLKIPVS